MLFIFAFGVINIIGSIHAGMIATRILVEWNFPDASQFDLNYAYRWLTHDLDIKHPIAISIDDAIFGKMIDVGVRRIVSVVCHCFSKSPINYSTNRFEIEAVSSRNVHTVKVMVC
jgi:hypothetical protein